jgi:hypothetical protein
MLNEVRKEAFSMRKTKKTDKEGGKRRRRMRKPNFLEDLVR